MSEGMLCSPRELAISGDHEGILILNDEGLEVGADVAHALELDLPVLDIEVEPNRPDFLSVLGVAREVAAATDVALRVREPAVEETDEVVAGVVPVTIEAPDACPRYLARIVRGVEHRPSPLRAQARLTAAGMRPIDAVVDATNYAMLERGQPLHGFDLARLAGPAIVVRRAADGETMRTLDDVDRSLTGADLLICDADGPVALAGVMGGQTSEVTAETHDVLLESAYFTRGGVLLTARRLDLHSEASHRFERGTDPEGLEQAATRCAQLMTAWAGGTVARGVTQAGELAPRRWVSMRPARAGVLLGYPVGADDAAAVFDTLGMVHRPTGDAIEVEVPGYRTDIDREVDLIEEVLRVQGYERVGNELPRAPHRGGVPEDVAFLARAKDTLVRAGLREIRPAPFASAEDLALFGDEDAIAVANPLRAEEGFLRTRLTPGLLHAIARNQARGVAQVALFEVGTTFRLGDPFREQPKLGFAMAGPSSTDWSSPRQAFDVLDATGVLELVLGELGLTGWRLEPDAGAPFHPGRSARVSVDGTHLGVVGEIHPRVAASLEIDGRVAAGAIGLTPLRAAAGEQVFEFRDAPRFPPVRRDLAFVLPADVAYRGVRDTLVEAGGPALDTCTLFDVFEGAPLEPGTRSLAFAVQLRAQDRTLTDDEAQAVIDGMVAAVGDRFGASVRTG
jgi:phenylalanyl-tRNA synthetase beta chain